jgi:hypothetical protein
MLLVRQAIPGVFSGTALNANYTSIENGFEDIGGYIVSGLTISAGTGLTVNVTTGVAILGGELPVTTPFTVTGLANGTTNHLYLLSDLSSQSNTTGLQPANSTKLGIATTAGGAVSSVSMTQSSGRQQRLMANTLILGGPAADITSAGHPPSQNLASWAASAGDGVSFYGTLPAGAVPGGALHPVLTTTVSYAATYSDYYILADATAGSITITLPTAVGHTGEEWVIKKKEVTANGVVIATTGGQTVDATTPPTITTPMQALHFVSDGANLWLV